MINLFSTRNEFDGPLDWQDKWLIKHPVEYDIGSNLGGRLIEAKRYRQAVMVLQKVAEVKRDYDVLYPLGYGRAGAGEKEEAEKYLLKATELDPTDYRAFYSLGYVYRDTDRSSKAKEAWAKVPELMPNLPEVGNNLRAIGQSI